MPPKARSQQAGETSRPYDTTIDEHIPNTPHYDENSKMTPPNVEIINDPATQAVKETPKSTAPQPTGNAIFDMKMKMAYENLDEIRFLMSEAKQSGDKRLLKQIQEQEQEYLKVVENLKKENPQAAAKAEPINSKELQEKARKESEADSLDSQKWHEESKNRQKAGFEAREI